MSPLTQGLNYRSACDLYEHTQTVRYQNSPWGGKHFCACVIMQMQFYLYDWGKILNLRTTVQLIINLILNEAFAKNLGVFVKPARKER